MSDNQSDHDIDAMAAMNNSSEIARRIYESQFNKQQFDNSFSGGLISSSSKIGDGFINSNFLKPGGIFQSEGTPTARFTSNAIMGNFTVTKAENGFIISCNGNKQFICATLQEVGEHVVAILVANNMEKR